MYENTNIHRTDYICEILLIAAFLCCYSTDGIKKKNLPSLSVAIGLL